MLLSGAVWVLVYSEFVEISAIRFKRCIYAKVKFSHPGASKKRTRLTLQSCRAPSWNCHIAKFESKTRCQQSS
eukprot:5680934-Amphidinium_carterae.1